MNKLLDVKQIEIKAMEKEKSKSEVKRATRTNPDTEPARVYRPRTATPRQVAQLAQEKPAKPASENVTEPEKPARRPKEASNEGARKYTPRTDRKRETPKFTDHQEVDEQYVQVEDRSNQESFWEDAEKPSVNHDDRRRRTSEKKDDSFGNESTHHPRSFRKDSGKHSDERGSRDDKPYRRDDRPAPFDRPGRGEGRYSREGRSDDRKPFRKQGERSASHEDRYKSDRKGDRPFRRDDDKPRAWRSDDSRGDYRPTRRFDRDNSEEGRGYKKPFGSRSKFGSDDEPVINRQVGPKKAYREAPSLQADSDGKIRLNKFIANTGLCSRREADEFIQNGQITVNGEVVTVLGTKVEPTDEICFKGKKLEAEHKVYILLNKPKDYITTSDDPHAKRTVLDLIEGACPERVYPVGRLDRNSTGLLLLTNDGEMTKRLTHPSYKKKKVYHVGLDRPLDPADMNRIRAGVELDGEKVFVDAIEYLDEGGGMEVGIEIHTGQNRVVRRIFEALDYKVSKLDRVYFAGLTKKNLPRGSWRFLTQKEVNMLKMNRFD